VAFLLFFLFYYTMSSLEKNDDGNEEEFHQLKTTTTTEQHEKEGRRQQKHHPLYHGTNLAPKALIFDCDGTILETMTLFFVADKQTCEEYGLELTKKRFYELAGVPIKEIFRLLRDEQGKTEEEITEEDLDRMTLRCGELAEEMGAPEIIQSTETIIMHGKRNGVPMAVASSGCREVVRMHLKQRGLLDLFDCVVTCEDVEHGKPAPDLYLLAAKKLRVDPKECTAYEDALLGIASAKKAGMDVVDVRQLEGYPNPEALFYDN
jgi:beta-phosphoglucomutase-like phosphatase (HAD superfamily)